METPDAFVVKVYRDYWSIEREFFVGLKKNSSSTIDVIDVGVLTLFLAILTPSEHPLAGRRF